MQIVRISTVEDPKKFGEWLGGQTLPFVEEDYEPCGWAYYWDYERFVNNYPIID